MLNDKRENFQFLGLLALTALVLYYAPMLKSVFFLIMSYLFLKSKKNYFWLAYFFVVIMGIGGFFTKLTDNVIELGAVDINLLFLYSFVSLIKVKRDKLEAPYFLKNHINVWIFYMVVLLYIGLLLIGNSGGGKSGYRYYYLITLMLPALTLLYTTYRFIPNEQALLNFSRLIFLVVFINVIGQFVHLLVGQPVYMFFAKSQGMYEDEVIMKDFTKKLLRPAWGATTMILAFFLAIYWQINKRHKFKQLYLSLIVFLTIFSIFITATRGWIIAMFFFIMSALYFVSMKNKLKILKIIFGFFLLFFIAYASSETVQIQTEKVVLRLATLEDLAKGDLSAGGTNSRLTNRNDPVMKLFYKRPIFGSGFSAEGLSTNDQHVGNQNILMSGGVVGFLIFVFLWTFIIRTVLRVHKENKWNKSYRGETLLLIPFFISLFIIHSSSMSIFGYIAYIKHPSKLLLIGVVFAIMNQIIFNFKKELDKNGE